MMEKLTSIDQLTTGVMLYIFNDGKKTGYEFLCVHPTNYKYILALDDTEREGKKLYIPYLLGETASAPDAVYIGKYDRTVYLEYKVSYHKKMAEKYEKYLLKSSKKS